MPYISEGPGTGPEGRPSFPGHFWNRERAPRLSWVQQNRSTVPSLYRSHRMQSGAVPQSLIETLMKGDLVRRRVPRVWTSGVKAPFISIRSWMWTRHAGCRQTLRERSRSR